MSVSTDVKRQLDVLISDGEVVVASFQFRGERHISEMSEADLRRFVTEALAAIVRVAGRDSEYFCSLPDHRGVGMLGVDGFSLGIVPALLGALKALRNSVENGFLDSLAAKLRECVHDELLIQAKDLCAQKYFIAAIVVGGGVLENHLRQLVVDRKLTWVGSGGLTKYNELLRGVYGQATWRRIQSIADIRNAAAHGNGQDIKGPDVIDALAFIERTVSDVSQVG